ncbi:MAG: ABC transporter ATP-binding protein [Clostridiales bacterium]|nr:ABC transporter ATP-binding protein [Clostridiales bacterium]MDY3745573.1 ABC transporter ATP-binding protein [Lachnospiraceae bacterium]
MGVKDDEQLIKGNPINSDVGEIAIKNLSFQYEDRMIIDNLSLSIKKGEKIAFVGESGSGKSTLVKILLGLLKYNKGEVCLGNTELSDICLNHLYDKVSYISQELVILDEATSAMDNLTEENVMKAVMQKLKEKTVIAIAHRLNTIAGFDKIILFRDGKIIGQGTFEELMRTDAYFMELYNANVQ